MVLFCFGSVSAVLILFLNTVIHVDLHCVKSVRIRSYSALHFPRVGKLRISPCSVQMREKADQNNSEYEHFLRKAMFQQNLFLTNTINKIFS